MVLPLSFVHKRPFEPLFFDFVQALWSESQMTVIRALSCLSALDKSRQSRNVRGLIAPCS